MQDFSSTKNYLFTIVAISKKPVRCEQGERVGCEPGEGGEGGGTGGKEGEEAKTPNGKAVVGKRAQGTEGGGIEREGATERILWTGEV